MVVLAYWFTADPHIGHDAIIKYSNRPFSSAKEMDSVILGYWQKLLKCGDSFYILGDLSFSKKKTIEAFRFIPDGVSVYFVFGNHDQRNRKVIETNYCVRWSGDLRWLKIGDQGIMLCHYAMRVWKNSHFGSWQLHGHSHDGLHPYDNQLDVGVDSAARLVGEYRPLSFEEISGFIKDATDSRKLAEQFGRSPNWVGGDDKD